MADDLALTKGLRMSFAAPGRAIAEADVLPPVDNGVSSRTLDAEEVEETLIDKMQDIRVAQVDRNAEIKEQLEALQVRQAAMQSKLAEEIVARDEQFAKLRAAMEAAFVEVEVEWVGRIERTYKGVNAEYPPLHRHLDELVKDEEEFYNKTVPDTNERMCGTHIRVMQGHREALKLDDTTIRAREAKLQARIDKHIEEYDVRCTVEAEDRQRQYDTFNKQFHDLMARMEGDTKFSEPRLMSRIDEIKAAIEVEAAARTKTDAGALELAMTTLQKIQHEALVNYGTEDMVEKFLGKA